MSTFINFSNHPSVNWDEKQLEAAYNLNGSKNIVDISFPEISPYWDEKQLKIIADEYIKKILEYHPQAVMCQGEFGMTYLVAEALMRRGIKVVFACSERDVIEIKNADGSSTKKSIFRFVRFREFCK